MNAKPKTKNNIRRIEIESPCSESWDHMSGDERKRFCARCSLHVHKLREMPRAEIESLINSGNPELCVQIERHADGSVITRDDHVPSRRSARRFFQAAAAGLLALLAACTNKESEECRPKPEVDITNKFGTPDPRITPAKIESVNGRVLMGKVRIR